MKEKIERYFFNLFYQKEKSIFNFFLFIPLWWLSLLYGAVIKIRFFLYKAGVFKKKKIKCLVISVGNIVVGGSGKTPVVIMLVRMFNEQGKKVAVLSRGYKSGFYQAGGKLKGEKKKFLVISDGENVIRDSFLAGDEPYLLARACKGIPVIIGKDRYISGKYALEKYATQVLVLDDGFQHLRLHRDLDIITIDALFPFSNGYLLPRGFLREYPSSLKRGDVFFITHTDQVKEEILENTISKLKEINPQAAIVKTVHQPVALVSMGFKKKAEEIDFLKGKDVVAICSIGNPLSFRKTLESLGAKIVDFMIFPDHYVYEKVRIEKILKSIKNEIIVTTQKDKVKIEHLKLDDRLKAGIFTLKVKLEIVGQIENFGKKIEEKMQNFF
ncbi:tetraacyldisaccharide 4'-kinase [bacterium]|nr:tetraacyldisaccharide 4'-kinase [bacterium]